MAGYSQTPLPQKLGIKPASKVIVLNAPIEYRRLLGEVPHGTSFSDRVSGGAKFVHLFATKRAELKRKLVTLRAKVADDAVVWISWPKKSSGVTSDVTEDVGKRCRLDLWT